jgi:hypothetical protein
MKWPLIIAAWAGTALLAFVLGGQSTPPAPESAGPRVGVETDAGGDDQDGEFRDRIAELQRELAIALGETVDDPDSTRRVSSSG